MPGKITELTNAGALTGAELVEVVDDVGTTPVSRKTTVGAITEGLDVMSNRRRLVAYDAPNRPNGALGTSDSGHVWSTSATYPWTIQNGMFKPSYPGDANVDGWAWIDCLSASAPGWRVGVTNVRATWMQGIIVAWADALNYVVAAITNTSANVVLVDAGVETSIVSSTTPATAAYPSGDASLRCHVSRATHQVTVVADSHAGPQVASADLTGTAGEAIINNNTKIGIVNQHPNTYFYDLWVMETWSATYQTPQP